MASRGGRIPFNVPGKYYVDSTCVDCHSCVDGASGIFKNTEESGFYGFVYRQPSTVEEEALAKQAMEECPVEAIGDDGHLGTEYWEAFDLWKNDYPAYLKWHEAKERTRDSH